VTVVGSLARIFDVADSSREVEELRWHMAQIDTQVLSLLDKRARAAREIFELRKEQPATLPAIDRAAIRELISLSNGDMPAQPLQETFRTIHSACLALELPVRVSFVGPEGGFGHAAAQGRFGHSSWLKAVDTPYVAVDDVARKAAEFAVVPFETSAENPVRSTIDALLASELRIVELQEVPVDLHVYNRTGSLGDILRLAATPADRSTCRRFLREIAESAEITDVRTPILACQMALDDGAVGAIARQDVAQPLGLRIAQSSVLDEGPSQMRYAVVGTRPSGRTESDLTFFIFGVDAAIGALSRALKVLTDRGIDLKRIQSYPVRAQGHAYLFCAESTGHFTDRHIVMGFEEIRRSTRFFKLLGSYPG
jgi:chorismate mutase/prephenate dehydratase